MLRVLKLKSISDRLQESPIYQSFLTSFKLIKLIVLLLYLSHFLGCFWYWVGTTDDLSFGGTGMTVYGWANLKEQEGEWTGRSQRDGDDVYDHGTNLWTRYLTALFHSLTDFGPEFATTDYEMLYVSFQHIGKYARNQCCWRFHEYL